MLSYFRPKPNEVLEEISGIDMLFRNDPEFKCITPAKLYASVIKNDLKRINLALDKGVSVNINDGSGYTALHYAAIWGHVDSVKLLISRGANVHAKTDGFNYTPLQLAENSKGYNNANECADIIRSHLK